MRAFIRTCIVNNDLTLQRTNFKLKKNQQKTLSTSMPALGPEVIFFMLISAVHEICQNKSNITNSCKFFLQMTVHTDVIT